jgi:two-component system cell cycle sensor histidine kinase/response regulator CckA
MQEREALKIEAAPLDPLTAADGFGGFLSTIFVVAALGAVVFGLISSGSGEPLVLTIMAVLAMLGMFLMFGIAAGHVRIGARTPAGDLLRAAADGSEAPKIIARPDGTVLYWNTALETMFGRSEAGPIAAIEQAVSGDPDAAQALFRIMRAAERGESRKEEIRLKAAPASTASRHPTWIRVAVRSFASPERANISGNTRDALAVWDITDISDDKSREALTIGSLVSAIAAFDTMPMGFISVAGDGTVTHINATFGSWLGLSSGSQAGLLPARGMKLADLAGEDGARLLVELARQADPERRSVDLDLAREDGHMVPLTLYVEPAATPAAANAAPDFTITALHRATPGLGARGGASEIRASHFFQSAPFGIATLDGEGRIAGCNAAFMRMVLDGRAANDQPALDTLCRNAETEERAKLQAGLAEVLSGRGNVAPVEITSGDQKQFFHRVYLSPLAAVPGGDAAAIYVIDATEQKALEARYAQAQKMEAVGQLAGGVAHDFNNVLQTITGFSDLLVQTHRPSDAAYKDIMHIKSAANRAAGLVSNLLGFSRKQTQQVAVLNLGESVSDIAPILKTALGEKIELKITSERDLWYVRADNNQIFNVVLNLARNARDAMPGGGRLTIRTRNVTERESQRMSNVVGFQPGEYVLIEVEDTGTGMSGEVMAKIFEPFFTTKGVGKGTGLGLASVYGIVKQSGGFIQPESEIGKGTTFKVYLPRHIVETEDEVETQQPKPAVKKEAVPADLTGTGRVLVVEDEVDVRQFAVRALKRQGYTVLEASDGVEALDIVNANEEEIDLVLSDVLMPEMDGPTLFKELRKTRPDLKVIFVSGYPNDAFREALGTDDFAFLPKPFTLKELATKVKEELGK